MAEVTTIRNGVGSENLLEELNRQRKSNRFCDVTIVVNETNFTAHQCVLVASCEYFEEIFDEQYTPPSAEICVPLKNVTAASMRDVLAFIYGEDICVSLDSVSDILHVAAELSVTSLLTELQDYLISNLDVTNCWRMLNLIRAFPLPRLQNCVISVLMEKFVKISKMDEFVKIPADFLEKLISSDDLTIKEESAAFEALIKWTSWDLASRKQLFPRLFKQIRLQLISPQYLASTVRFEKLVKEFPACVEEVQDAFHFHIEPTAFDKQHKRNSPLTGCIGALLAVPNRMMHVTQSDNLNILLIRSRCTVDDVCSVATFDGMKATFCGYLCNGRSTQNVLQLVFERDKQNWETLPNLIKPRCGAAAVYCQGHLYVFGGQYVDFVTIQHFVEEVEMLDREINEWISINKMPKGKSFCRAVVLNKEIYVLGGYVEKFTLHSGNVNPIVKKSNSVEIYNPASNSWKSGPSMNTARASFAAEVVKHQIIVLGGDTFASCTIESLHAGADVWTKVVSEPAFTVGRVFTGVLGGRILLTEETGENLWSSEVTHENKLRWTECGRTETDLSSEKTDVGSELASSSTKPEATNFPFEKSERKRETASSSSNLPCVYSPPTINFPLPKFVFHNDKSKTQDKDSVMEATAGIARVEDKANHAPTKSGVTYSLAKPHALATSRGSRGKTQKKIEKW